MSPTRRLPGRSARARPPQPSTEARVKVYLAQIDTTVGDIEGNLARVLNAVEAARGLGAELAVFPELTLTGYPPRDLVEKGAFVRANLGALERAAHAAQ